MVSEAWARLSMDTHPDDLSVYLICVLYVEVIIFLREARHRFSLFLSCIRISLRLKLLASDNSYTYCAVRT
jgi:hypothetical protein